MKKQIFLILSVLIGILCLTLINATTISDNQYLKADNLTINGSGAYLSNGANLNGVSSGTADVVVCRGTSVWDDYYKSIKWMSGCDVVCKSTDGDCGNDINNSIITVHNNGGGKVYISNGLYPILVNNAVNGKPLINVWGNVELQGESSSNTILQLTGNLGNEVAPFLLEHQNLDGSITYGGGIHDLQIDFNGTKLGYGTYTGNKFIEALVSANGINAANYYNLIFRNGNVTNASGTSQLQAIAVGTFECPNCNYHDIYIEGFDNSLWITKRFPSTITQYSFNNIFINNSLKTGIYFENSFNDLFNNIHISNSKYPLDFNGGASSLFINNLNILNSVGNGISFFPASSVKDLIISNFKIENVQNDQGNNNGISIAQSGSNLKFSNGVIINVSGRGLNINGNKSTFDNIRIYNSSIGVFVDGIDNEFYKIKAENNSQGFYMRAGRCIDCTAIHNNNQGFVIDTLSSKTIYLINPYAYDDYSTVVQTHGIDISTANNSVIINPLVLNSPNNVSFIGVGNQGYVDNFQYSLPINATNYPCTQVSPYSERTIHNSSTSCTCTGGAWKCWGMN